MIFSALLPHLFFTQPPDGAANNVVNESVREAQKLVLYGNGVVYCNGSDPLFGVAPDWFLITSRLQYPTNNLNVELFSYGSVSPAPSYYFQKSIQTLSDSTVIYEVVFGFPTSYNGIVYLGYTRGTSNYQVFYIPTRSYLAERNYNYRLVVAPISVEAGAYTINGQLFYGVNDRPYNNGWQYSLSWWFGSPTNTSISLTNPTYSVTTTYNDEVTFTVKITITITSSSDAGKQIKYIRLLVYNANNVFQYYALRITLTTPFTIAGAGDQIVIQITYSITSSL